jgi:aminopeptidase N
MRHEERALSLNRGFSAPVILKVEQGGGERAFLMAHDRDAFARWEAGQQYASDLLLRQVQSGAAFDPAFVAALGEILRDEALDPAFAAEAIMLPSEDYIAERMATIDVEAIHQARESLRRTIATTLEPELRRVHDASSDGGPYSPDAASAGRRALKNATLAYLAALPQHHALVTAQVRSATNMTDRAAALRLLVDLDIPEREAALDDFYQRYAGDTLVLDKWFALQAVSALPDALAKVEALLQHPAFSLRNPNKVRALVGSFTAANPLRYHAADGTGYAFHVARTLELDPINPQVAARLLAPLGRWRRFDSARQALMTAALTRILAAPRLSRDVYEIAAKSLGRAS